jgi:hypothetical protein
VLAEAERVRKAPAAVEAERLAPAAFARADDLRRRADQAFEDGDLAGAQLIAERAIAAYADAVALARVAKAERESTSASSERDTKRVELAALEGEQRRVSAELEALELRVKATRDAQPIVPSGPADPAREQARREAARALSIQARLLCTGARLLLAPAAPSDATAGGADRASAAGDLDAAEAALAKLDASLAAGGPVPIDEAGRVRAGCLAALTRVRRAAAAVGRAPGAGDELLATLSASALSPSRDDRGVVVALREPFRAAGLSADGEARLASLARVAAAHPAFPVAVVVHEERASPRDAAMWRSRADAVVQKLRASGVTRVEAVLAGAGAPLVDPSSRDRARNSRVEIVFVTPEAL